MLVDASKCAGCGKCLWYCNIGNAISLVRSPVAPHKVHAEVDQDRCLECGSCLRAAKCPKDALYEWEQVFERPRSIRKFFNDPNATHKETGIPGRGTEECKTNDVTGRIKRGKVGVAVEFGRPHVGASFEDVEKFTTAMFEMGCHFEKNNPFTALMDPMTGKMLPETKTERLLSGIMELELPIENLTAVLTRIQDVAKTVECVVSLDIVSRYEADGTVPAIALAQAAGIKLRPNAKINVGLGRPLAREEEAVV